MANVWGRMEPMTHVAGCNCCSYSEQSATDARWEVPGMHWTGYSCWPGARAPLAVYLYPFIGCCCGSLLTSFSRTRRAVSTLPGSD